MFLSSVLIYAINFISRKVGDKRFFNILIYVFIILVSGIVISHVISACLTGALCGVLLKYFKLHIEKIPQKVNNALCVLCILFPFGLHNILYSLVVKCFDIMGVTIGIVRYLAFRDAVWGVLYFALLILLLSSNNIIQNALSCKALRKLNQFSFGIYSFHWPLICSIGALIMIAMPLKNGIIVAWVICIIITFAVSIIYHFIFEKNINRLLNKYF